MHVHNLPAPASSDQPDAPRLVCTTVSVASACPERWGCCGSLRQNKETHLLVGQDDIVNKIEFRISRYTFLPGYNGEPLHVMYTTPGHGYGMSHCHSVAWHALAIARQVPNHSALVLT